MARPRVAECRLCGEDRRPKLRRFALIHSVQRSGHRTTRGAGAVTLCQPCWDQLTDGSRFARTRYPVLPRQNAPGRPLILGVDSDAMPRPLEPPTPVLRAVASR